jgi:hypothetical protein
MAWTEVPDQPVSRFLRMKDVFSKVGDKFLGLYLSHAPNPNGYGEDYFFRTDIGDISMTFKGGLKRQVDKALTAGLQPGMLVAIQFRESKDVGKESPMKIFKFAYDPAFKGAPPKNGANVAAPPAVVPVVEADEDLPF